MTLRQDSSGILLNDLKIKFLNKNNEGKWKNINKIKCSLEDSLINAYHPFSLVLNFVIRNFLKNIALIAFCIVCPLYI